MKKQEEKFKCDECGEKFVNKIALRSHIKRTHSKKQEEQFKCDECGEIFMKKIDLRTHIKRTHPKNISCDICDKIFHESWQYERHLESHSIVKDKKCDICEKNILFGVAFNATSECTHASSSQKLPLLQ